MIVSSFDIPLSSRSDKVYFVPLGDIHYGTLNCEIDKFLEIVQWIKNTPNCYWIGMGDMAEFISLQDPRFDIKNIDHNLKGHLDNLALKQLAFLIEKLKPIANKCVGVLDGNHEETIRLKQGLDVIGNLTYRLKIKRLGSTCFVNLKLRRMTGGYSAKPSDVVTVFATHGWGGGGRYIGGDLNKCMLLAKDFDADIFLFAHTHKKASVVTEMVGCSAKTDKVLSYKKVYCLTGSFYNPYNNESSSYAEKKCFPLQHIGITKIIIRPFRTMLYDGKQIPIRPDIHISE